jgi:hypothetical protein
MISTRVGALVFKRFDQTVEDDRKNRPKQRTKPVDPMVAIELSVDYVGPKGASWIERSAGEENTYLCQCADKTLFSRVINHPPTLRRKELTRYRLVLRM